MRSTLRRVVGAVGGAAALTLLCGSLAWGAPAKSKEPERPSYALPNLVAVVAAAVMLSIPCKRFRRA
jgi:hypothetical protein